MSRSSILIMAGAISGGSYMDTSLKDSLLLTLMLVCLACWVVCGSQSIYFRKYHNLMISVPIFVFSFIVTVYTLDGVAHYGGYREPFIRLMEAVIIMCTALGAPAYFYIERNNYRARLSDSSMRHGCDNLPEGICFAFESGIPRLTNRKMQELSQEIVGRPVYNIHTFWEQIQAIPMDEVHRVNFTDTPTLRLEDGSIWNFTFEVFYIKGEPFLELRASDVSQLFELSKKIELENARLTEQNRELELLMKDIVRMKQEEEILDSKMRVHYELGRAVLQTGRSLTGTIPMDAEGLKDLWSGIITGMESNLFSKEQIYDATQELVSLANATGCELIFEGEFRGDSSLLISTVREALVNSVRHGHASEVRVTARPDGGLYFCEIRDNGIGAADSSEGAETGAEGAGHAGGSGEVHLGGGLSMMAKSIQDAGGFITFEYPMDGGFAIKLCLPDKAL